MPEAKKSTDIPITQKMLNEKIQELNHKITSVSLDVKSVEQNLGGKVDALQSEVKSIRAEIKSVEQRLDGKIEAFRSEVKSGNEMILSELRKMSASNEEQNSRNLVVLDALVGINERQDRMEREFSERLDAVETAIKDH